MYDFSSGVPNNEKIEGQRLQIRQRSQMKVSFSGSNSSGENMNSGPWLTVQWPVVSGVMIPARGACRKNRNGKTEKWLWQECLSLLWKWEQSYLVPTPVHIFSRKLTQMRNQYIDFWLVIGGHTVTRCDLSCEVPPTDSFLLYTESSLYFFVEIHTFIIKANHHEKLDMEGLSACLKLIS